MFAGFIKWVQGVCLRKPVTAGGGWFKGIFAGPRMARARMAAFRPGFTLVELLLVVTIIGVLAALVVPRFVGRSQQARETAARQEIVGTIGVALDLFEQDMGRYPTVEEGLEVLIMAPSQGDATNWHGPYLKSATTPRDPWNGDYRYTYPSQLTEIATLYDVVSAGADGQFGTDDDITNHNASQRDNRQAGTGLHTR